jgi:hypothetical protein
MPLMNSRTGAVAALFLSAASGVVEAQTTVLGCPRREIGAKYGWCVAGLPDVNGDGRGDIAIGAESESVGSRPNAGRVYIVSGTGQYLRVIVPPTAQPVGTFGWCVAGMPDVTGDGRGEVLITGVWEADTQGRLCGRAYMYNGASGQMIRAWVSPARQEGGCFGWSIASIPDVNGDGRADVAVGAPYENAGGRTASGRVYIYSGATGQYIRTLWSPSYQIDGQFGHSVAGIADVNGDGRGDIIVGAPGEYTASTPAGSGRAYVFSGATGQLIRTHRSATPAVNGNFGYSVAAVGDSNGDGVQEVLVGAPHEASAQLHPAGGKAHLFSGANGVGLRRMSSPGAQTQGNFGTCVSAVPNTDGSPSTRMIIGAPEEIDSGRAYIIGTPGDSISVMYSQFPHWKGKFGACVAGLPDVNGNGGGEVLIGAPSEAGFGRTYLVRH